MKNMKKLFVFGMIWVTTLFCACGKENAIEEVEEETVVEETPEAENLLTGKHYAMIEVKDYGEITVEVDADVAPISATNFMKLVDEGFYDGLTFHRIISGFMIQGGDPTGTGAGGSDQTIKGEFYSNGVANDMKHLRGTISMARSQDYDSASSQFFICHEDSDWLDGEYAAFGHVVAGMEVVDAICENTPVLDNNGSVAKDEQPVIEHIYNVTAEYLDGEAASSVLSNPLEELTGKNEFESYDEIIDSLSEDMSYAYVDIMGWDEPVLLINCEGTYDNGDGNMAAIEAFPYFPNAVGKMVCGSLFSSSGTAYPISVSKDGKIFCGGNHEINVYAITTESGAPAIMAMAYLYETFDEEGNATNGGFVRDTNKVLDNEGSQIAEDDSETLAHYYDLYNDTTAINFIKK